MDFYGGVALLIVDEDKAEQITFEELATENARLRQLVGELLLKNQLLREIGLQGSAAMELPQTSA